MIRILILAMVVVGCTDAAPTGAPSAATEGAAPAPKAPATGGEAPAPEAGADGKAAGTQGKGTGDGSGGGSGGRRFRQASVYLDGVALAAVLYGELPPGLRSTWHVKTTSEGEEMKVRRFLVAAYLQALGIDLARVQEVHFYGGRQRVGRLPGAELRAHAADLAFSFSRSTSGKPRMHWPAEIGVSDKIDVINAIAVYVDKAAPTWNADRWQLEIGGQPVEGIPYSSGENGGGTRLYVDGRLARTLKPKSLGTPDGTPPRWALATQIATAGVALDRVQAVDLIAGDQLVRRLDAATAAAARFEVGDQGRLTVFPGEWSAEAIQVYVQATPIDPEAR